MKPLTNDMMLAVLVFFVLTTGAGLQACTTRQHMVLASTGTVIGIEIGQNPASQSPQAKLGYNRGELAIVPTDRLDTGASSGSIRGSAKDVADVLMELRYGGVFDLGSTSAIYQRLAIGTTAVRQDGAALMFAKNAQGELDAKAVSAIRALPSVKEEVERDKTSMRLNFEELYNKNKKAPELEKFETAAKAAGYKASGPADYPAFRNFIGDLNAPLDKIRVIRQSLELQGVSFLYDQ